MEPSIFDHFVSGDIWVKYTIGLAAILEQAAHASGQTQGLSLQQKNHKARRAKEKEGNFPLHKLFAIGLLGDIGVRAIKLKALYLQLKYAAKPLFYLPITFIKRVVFGKDPYWRQYFFNKWGFLPKELIELCRKRPTIWIDAMSGGEVTQLFTFCELLKKELPAHNIVVSTNNYLPLLLAKKIKDADYVFDSPWDIGWVAVRALKKVRPVLFAVLDQLNSPMLLIKAKELSIPAVILSGFMSKGFEKSLTLKRQLALGAFKHADHVCAREEQDALGYAGLGVQRQKIHVLGNMKFDVDYIRLRPGEREAIRADFLIPEGGMAMVGGSIHADEDRFLCDAYLRARESISDLKLFLVPRYNSYVLGFEACLRERGITFIRRTDMAGAKGDTDFDAVIVNTFGELSRLYGAADFIFIGGSVCPADQFGYGQSIIEPLIHGAPIFFGPHMKHWEEYVKELKEVWPQLEILAPQDLALGMICIAMDRQLAAKLEKKCLEIVSRFANGVENHARFISNLAKGARCN